MPIFNTERLTRGRGDLMNVGLRSYPVSIGEINELADYYGLGVRTVQRWFAAQGRQYRRCVPRYAWAGFMPIAGGGTEDVPGWRIYRMYDSNNPSGVGDGKGADGKGTSAPVQNMRLRCLLAACLGVDGGIEREAIYTGKQRVLTIPYGTIAESVNGANDIYTGNSESGGFMQRAWVSMTISPDIRTPVFSPGWVLSVTYNGIGRFDESDGEEEEIPEEEEEDLDDGFADEATE